MPGPPRRHFAIVLAIIAIAVGAIAGCSSRGHGMTAAAPPPPSNSSLGTAAEAAQIVQGLSDEDLVGQVLMPSVNLSDPPNSSADLVRRYHLGGLILMGDVEKTGAGGTAAQVKALTDAVRRASQGVGGITADPLLATDQEYGWVTRIKSGVVQLPSGMAFGAAGRPELTEAAWRAAGNELASIGINVDFAPDADVLASPNNTVIGSRSFGADASAVAGQVGAAVRGLQSAGLAASLKHFPGHGNTDVNSHEALPVLSQSRSSLDSDDLPPFRAGIDAGAMMVMSGHLDVQAIDPGVPASFSDKVLVDLLRGQLKFGGVVVSDALNMQPAKDQGSPGDAAVKALLAGNDLLLMPPDLQAAQVGLLDALDNGHLPRERLVEAATRVVALRLHLTGTATPSPVDSAANAEAARQASAAAVTVLKGSCTGPLVSGEVRVAASTGRGQQVRWLTDALRARGMTVVTEGGQLVHLVGYRDDSADLAPDAAVAVAMDTPYLLESSAAPVRIATYSSTQAAMDSLAAVITGKAPATGRSPVPLPTLPSSACTP